MHTGTRILISFGAVALALLWPLHAAADSHGEEEKLPVSEIISEHTADSYWWHITTINHHHVSIYLPVIVYSGAEGWLAFSSKRLAHGETYKGFRIAGEGKYKGKITGVNAAGEEYRPWDISITKNALALMINSAIMLSLFLSVARWYRRRPKNSVPGKFVCAIEMFVMDIYDDIIRKNIGDGHQRYAPYLLTAFFFILINNVMGLIPVFPGGANTTGNIAITCVLALCTMFAVNVFGNREYWKEIFWPDVPVWLKVPVPIIPVIELFGVFTKPFALMIRLLANIFAGHTVILSLMFIIFVTVKMGVAMNAGMTLFSVVLSIIMNCLELLVAYIQAYVFTMLSAMFIGLSRPSHHPKKIKA
ncbi:MAG: F0F1 ATP synthase subunit A [Prevotellaceae bacterium]|jgi:F-type H+-transporting ATPase subunit a|nr:F0F1 ATP synthase subunit A [Prevotellaceae bacterium]